MKFNETKKVVEPAGIGIYTTKQMVIEPSSYTKLV